MADVDQTIAAQIRPPTAPDIIGPITSLAQLQYMAAQGAKVQADTALTNQGIQFGAGRLSSLQRYNTMLQGGVSPEDAIVKSGLSALDPTGADAALKNVQQQRELSTNRTANPANPASYSLAGPAAVQAASGALSTQAGTAKTQQETVQLQAEHYGQIGTIMASDPSPQGRAQAVALARQFQVPDQMIQQFASLPDAQYVEAGKHFQQASMTPEKYADVSGQSTFNKGVAEAATFNKPLGPTDVLSQGPAAAAAMRGQPVPGLPVQQNPSLQPSPGPSAAGGPIARTSTGALVATDPNGNAAGPAAAPAAPPPFASQNGSGSPGLSNNRQNNPGNIRDGAFARSQPGYLGSANGFAIFSSPLYGQAAMEKNLAAYGRRGIDTPLGITSKWAPVGDGANDPQSYARTVAASLGIGINDKIDLSDPAQRSAVAVAMSKVENGPSGAQGARPAVGPAAVPVQGMPGVPTAGAVAPPPGAPGLPPPPVRQIPPPGTATSPAGSIIQPLRQGAGIAPSPAAPIATAASPQIPASPAAPLAATAGSAPPPTGLAADQTAPPPSGYQPVTQGMGPAALKMQEGIGAAQAAQFKEAKEGYQQATIGQQNLGQLQAHLSDMPGKGFLTPGAYAQERLGWARFVNTGLAGAGYKPFFPPDDIASAEAAQKITGKLGFDTSALLGKHEAAAITQQAISLNPGIQNTPAGAKIVAASINAGLQRQRDFYQYFSTHATDPSADIHFAQSHPTSMYVQEAQALAKIPQSAVALLRQYGNDPRAAAAFDQRFGKGLSRYYTEGGQ